VKGAYAGFDERPKWFPFKTDLFITDHSKQTTFVTDLFKTGPFITDHVHNRPRS